MEYMEPSGWYKSGLEVTISTNDERVKEIHYKITNSENISGGTQSGGADEEGYQIATGNTITIPITTLGRTNITAYVTDRKKQIRNKHKNSKI